MANEKRLIDAYALIEDIEKRYCEPCKAEGKDYHEVACRACWVDDMILEIDPAPTVDAVEVVHGYWIDSYNADHMGRIIEHGIDCSVCDSVFKDDSREVVKHWKEQFKVCPFCGAKMDGDGNG